MIDMRDWIGRAPHIYRIDTNATAQGPKASIIKDTPPSSGAMRESLNRRREDNVYSLTVNSR